MTDESLPAVFGNAAAAAAKAASEAAARARAAQEEASRKRAAAEAQAAAAKQQVGPARPGPGTVPECSLAGISPRFGRGVGRCVFGLGDLSLSLIDQPLIYVSVMDHSQCVSVISLTKGHFRAWAK